MPETAYDGAHPRHGVEERAEELEAVMDAAGFEQAALMGLSEGGPAAILARG